MIDPNCEHHWVRQKTALVCTKCPASIPKPRLGRPTRNEPIWKVSSLRPSAEEKSAIVAAAKEDGVTIGDWLLLAAKNRLFSRLDPEESI